MTHLRVVNWILLFVPLRGVTMAFALFIFEEVDSFSVPLRGVTIFCHKLNSSHQ